MTSAFREQLRARRAATAADMAASRHASPRATRSAFHRRSRMAGPAASWARPPYSGWSQNSLVPRYWWINHTIFRGWRTRYDGKANAITASMGTPLDSERSRLRHIATWCASSAPGYHLNGTETTSASCPASARAATSCHTWISAPPLRKGVTGWHTATRINAPSSSGGWYPPQDQAPTVTLRPPAGRRRARRPFARRVLQVRGPKRQGPPPAGRTADGADVSRRTATGGGSVSREGPRICPARQREWVGGGRRRSPPRSSATGGSSLARARKARAERAPAILRSGW